MSTVVRAYREGDNASLVPTGSFDLPNATAVVRELQSVEDRLSGCQSVNIDLAQLDRIDGTGAILLAGFLDRLDAGKCHPHIVEGHNPDAARLIGLYRDHRSESQVSQKRPLTQLERIGALAAQFPGKATAALDFTGRCAVALPKVAATPSSVDWLSLPRLIQEIGADALLVTSAANLLVGVIIGFLGVSELGAFGAIAYVPGLVVVAHFRELGRWSPQSSWPAAPAPVWRQRSPQ
jgi:phospholipid/cholesterol/gamma-HCH transport system permease protein